MKISHIYLYFVSSFEALPILLYPAPNKQTELCQRMLSIAINALQVLRKKKSSQFVAPDQDRHIDIRWISLPTRMKEPASPPQEKETGLLLLKDRDINTELLKLRHQNRELEAIFESSHDGIVVADGKGVLLRISKSYFRITGIPKEKLLGKNVVDMVTEGVVTPSGTSLVLKDRQAVTLTQTFLGGRTSIVTSTPVTDDNGEIIRVVTNVRDMTEIQKLRDELAESRKKLDHFSQLVENLTQTQYAEEGMIFRSQRMAELHEKALKFAPVDASLLITGESGVGKEVIANFVHRHSPRRSSLFLKINCGAIPEQLLESELFGYEGGSFTGSKRDGHIGLAEMANGGTLFLDEIGELPLNLQVKLLRFVQNKEFFRVGGNRALSVDVRIIAATNQNLERMVEERRFRADLFYRLNVCTLHVPSLTERQEDIVPLAHHFLRLFNKKYKTLKRFSPMVYRAFELHTWKGNVRELENIVERLVIVSPGNLVEADNLPEDFQGFSGKICLDQPGQSYRDALENFEKNFWTKALQQYSSIRLAAKTLGVDHSTIVKKMTRLGLRKTNAPQ